MFSVRNYLKKQLGEEKCDQLFGDVPEWLLTKAGCRLAEISFQNAERHDKHIDRSEAYDDRRIRVYNLLRDYYHDNKEQKKTTKFPTGFIDSEEPQPMERASSIFLGVYMEKLAEDCIKQPNNVVHAEFIELVKSDLKARDSRQDLDWIR